MDLSTLKNFTEQFDTIACILSVTTNPDGSYDKICIEGGNEAYLHSFPPQVHFIPGQIYTNYIPKDLN
ncbi:MAG: GGDEF domain-containing protein, partial [Hallerella sp.]|nr:GGDEF domain-containing protein [Hallerella sp.]